MCNVCGLLGVEDDWSGGVQRHHDGAPKTRRADRAERIRILNLILQDCRVQVSDFEGQSFLVCGPTGKQKIADNIAHVWQCVRDITGVGIDPLVPSHAGQSSDLSQT
jgi:hypothetical protein